MPPPPLSFHAFYTLYLSPRDTLSVPTCLTNLRFRKAAEVCKDNRPAQVLVFQQLAAAEPYTVSGRAAAGWLLRKMGPFPHVTPEEESMGQYYALIAVRS